MNTLFAPVVGFTVSYLMAIVDFIPVILFMIAMGYVIRMSHGRITTKLFAVLCGGVFVSFLGGLAKCTWKLIYAHGVDFVPLNTAFVIYQTTGFFLIAIGVIALLVSDIKAGKIKKANPLTMSVTLIPGLFLATVVVMEKPGFLWYIVMAFFTCTYLIVLSVIAFRNKQLLTGLLFYASMIFMFGMVGLRSKFDEGGAWEQINWIAQICNSVTQLLLLIPCLRLSKILKPVCPKETY
jgi:hypothetical protein